MTAQEQILVNEVADLKRALADLKNTVALLVKGLRGAMQYVPQMETRV